MWQPWKDNKANPICLLAFCQMPFLSLSIINCFFRHVVALPLKTVLWFYYIRLKGRKKQDFACFESNLFEFRLGKVFFRKSKPIQFWNSPQSCSAADLTGFTLFSIENFCRDRVWRCTISPLKNREHLYQLDTNRHPISVRITRGLLQYHCFLRVNRPHLLPAIRPG